MNPCEFDREQLETLAAQAGVNAVDNWSTEELVFFLQEKGVL